MSAFSRLTSIFAARETADPQRPDERRIPVPARTLAGIVITADNCITVPTVWACLRYISQTVAVLPWNAMRAGQSGGQRAGTHPIDTLISTRPNPEWSSFQFRESLLHWALRWGNGYAEIERDQLGRPVALWPIHPSRVHVLRDDAGGMIYRVHNGVLAPVDLQPMDMFHIRGFGEGPVGINVCEYASESIGWARAAQLFGAGFFGNGMNVSAVIESVKPLSEPAMKRVKAALNKLYRGVRGERVFFADAGMKYTPIGIEPEKAQFLATNEFLVTEICRWFGVPPHKVASLDRSSKSNAESQVTEVVVDSIAPWVKRFEDEADYKLFGANRPGYYTKMNMNALMRGDSASRGTYYQQMRQMGVYSANDILRREDENLIPAADGGDKRFMQVQYVTLDKAGDGPPAAPPAHIAPPEPQPPEPPPSEKAAQAAIAALAEMEFDLVA